MGSSKRDSVHVRINLPPFWCVGVCLVGGKGVLVFNTSCILEHEYPCELLLREHDIVCVCARRTILALASQEYSAVAQERRSYFGTSALVLLDKITHFLGLNNTYACDMFLCLKSTSLPHNPYPQLDFQLALPIWEVDLIQRLGG